MNEEAKEMEKIKANEKLRHFDKTFIKISKKLRTLEGDDQIKMIRLIIARFTYEERLAQMQSIYFPRSR